MFGVLLKQQSDLNTQSIVLPFPSNSLIYILFNLIYLKRFKQGVFHITGHVHYAALALPKRSTVLTIHDLVFLNSYHGIKKKVMKWLFLDLPLKRVKWVTVVSEKTKKEILLHSSCDPDKILVIENPLDPQLKYATYDFNITRPLILFVGTQQNKNLENVVPALYNLDVQLRIIGDLSHQQKVLLSKFNISYTAAVQLNDEELINEYHQCDLVLFPSFYEGFGLPVVEAFSVGKPVITSAISPMLDIAKDAAVYVDPNSISSIRNAVKEVIKNPSLRNQKITQGLEIVKAYQAPSIAVKYQQLWKKIAKENLIIS